MATTVYVKYGSDKVKSKDGKTVFDVGNRKYLSASAWKNHVGDVKGKIVPSGTSRGPLVFEVTQSNLLSKTVRKK